MSKKQKIEEALKILTALELPVESMTDRRKKRVAMALLAVANIKSATPWTKACIWGDASAWNLTTRQIISYWNNHYGENLSRGSYDDVRREDLAYLVEADIVNASAGKPNANTNNPTRGYAISIEAKDVLRLFGDDSWNDCVKEFIYKVGSLKARINKRRNIKKIPVILPTGQRLNLSAGPHNDLQKAIIEEFLPRYAHGAQVLYIGDTHKKALLVDDKKLNDLGFFKLKHDMLPDVVAYDKKRKWIFLIEAVHSSNPISHLRHLKLEKMSSKCKAPIVYVSVFRDRKSFGKWVVDISWETEVWLADSPDHLIHFNGDKFLGPYTG